MKVCVGLDVGVCRSALLWSAPLKCISGFGPLIYWCDNYLRRGLEDYYEPASNRPLHGQYLTFLTSNQVRLPAELKHINKRRKRN